MLGQKSSLSHVLLCWAQHPLLREVKGHLWRRHNPSVVLVHHLVLLLPLSLGSITIGLVVQIPYSILLCLAAKL